MRLVEILKRVGETRAAHVSRQFGENKWKRDCLAIAIMNPAAPLWLPSPKALLATLAFGEGGEEFLPYAVFKAVDHRDRGEAAGFGFYMDMVTSPDGAAIYAGSTCVDRTIGAASAQFEIQDACEAGHGLVTFNYLIRAERKGWHESHPDHKWSCEANQPGPYYAAILERTTIWRGRM